MSADHEYMKTMDVKNACGNPGDCTAITLLHGNHIIDINTLNSFMSFIPFSIGGIWFWKLKHW